MDAAPALLYSALVVEILLLCFSNLIVTFLACRILNNEDEYSKEDDIGTPSHRSNLSPEQSDLMHQTSGKAYSSGKASTLITPFGQRTEKFAVRFSINQQSGGENGKMEHDIESSEDDFIKKVQPHKRCSLAINGTKPEPGCRFMYDRTEDRVSNIFHGTKLLLSLLHIYTTDHSHSCDAV